jgi:hypothetical protein
MIRVDEFAADGGRVSRKASRRLKERFKFSVSILGIEVERLARDVGEADRDNTRTHP